MSYALASRPALRTRSVHPGYGLALGAAPDCSDAAVTGIKAIDDPIVGCCQDVRSGSGSAKDKAEGVALCIERGVAVGIGAAAGAATASAVCTATGVGAAVAPVCGAIGSAIGALLGSRVAGYTTGSKVMLGVGTAICGPSCGFVLAEMSEFLSETVGPIISGIFSPGAANQREKERRRAEHSALLASEQAMRDAEAATVEAWKASINRIWDLFDKMFPAKSQKTEATKAIGISASYLGIAAAYLRLGLPLDKLPDATVERYRKQGAQGCEIYGRKVDGSYGPVTGVCPPFWWQRFLADPRNTKASAAPVIAADLADDINLFFEKLQAAEITLAAQIVTFSATQKAAAIIKSSSSIDSYLVGAQKGAARARAALNAAKKASSASEAEAQADKAELAANTADQAMKSILATALANPTIKPGERGTKAYLAAEQAGKDAAEARAVATKKRKAQTALIVFGVLAAAGTAGYLYATR